MTARERLLGMWCHVAGHRWDHARDACGRCDQTGQAIFYSYPTRADARMIIAGSVPDEYGLFPEDRIVVWPWLEVRANLRIHRKAFDPILIT